MFNFKNQRKMKKVVRMLGLCALVALAFTSCKKKETNAVTFTATINQPTSSTRTHGEAAEDYYYAVWDKNDVIKVVNPDRTEAKDFQATSRSEQNATFNVTGEANVNFLSELETATYTAFYPSADFDPATQEVRVEVKDEQNLVVLGCSFADETYPMYGVNSTNNGRNFVFDSDAGFLTFWFEGDYGDPAPVYSFDKVKIHCENNFLAGKMVYKYDVAQGKYVYDNFEGTSKDIEVYSFSQPGKLFETSYGQPAYVSFVLPAGQYSNIDVYIYKQGEELYHFQTSPLTIVAKTYNEMPRKWLTEN